MIENVRGLLDARFGYYRELIEERLRSLGYETRFELLNASNFGVPQNRPRVFIVGLRPEYASAFVVPEKLAAANFRRRRAVQPHEKRGLERRARVAQSGARASRPPSSAARKSMADPTSARRAPAPPGPSSALTAGALCLGASEGFRRFSPIDHSDGRRKSRASPMTGRSPAAKPRPTGRPATRSPAFGVRRRAGYTLRASGRRSDAEVT